MTTAITSPYDPALDELCRDLAARANDLDAAGDWPREQLELFARHGVYEWFVSRAWGGQDWDESDLIRGYLRLSQACLTSTFILTQRSGACRRIAESDNEAAKQRWLRALAEGSAFATVGISHLTTSRRHLAGPVLRADETADGFTLGGYSPWVTGAAQADTIVLGASLDDGRQVLLAMPTDLSGVSFPPPARLVGLSASQTGQVRCDGVKVERRWLLAGPIENVLAAGPAGAKTGGLQTSTLALGLAKAAIDFVGAQSAVRDELRAAASEFEREWQSITSDLFALATGRAACTSEALRVRANSLALRASQAALAAAKGSGFVLGHPAGRWCREALFFLVWSCPQGVVAANLCELAGLAD